TDIEIGSTGYIRPKGQGKAEVTVSVGTLQTKVPVAVKDAAVPEIHFVRDVMPVLSRVGCNAGTCHGAAKGKNGFKLSLRGYDPLFDHRSLTDDLSGRRFNRAAPDASLMLLKTSGAVPHVGGALTRPGEPYSAATLVVMGDRTGFVWKPAPEYNWVDALVYEKLKEVKVLPSGVCTDAEFIRRVSLDLTGLPPTPEQVRAFLADRRDSRVK